MSTTDSPGPSFADRLRALADLYDQHPDLPDPTSAYLHTSAGPDGFLAALAVAAGEPVPDSIAMFVAVPLPGGFTLNFWRDRVGEKRTVTREVVEYVLPERVSA